MRNSEMATGLSQTFLNSDCPTLINSPILREKYVFYPNASCCNFMTLLFSYIAFPTPTASQTLAARNAVWHSEGASWNSNSLGIRTTGPTHAVTHSLL